MFRHAANSNHHIVNENEGSALHAKDSRISSLKADAMVPVTPRRAFGNIKNVQTPASGLKKHAAPKSASKKPSILVFEDDPDGKEPEAVEASDETNLCNSFEMLCSKNPAEPSPWTAYPEIEVAGTVPLSPTFVAREETCDVTLRDEYDCDETFDEMCARLYQAPEPWSLEEIPPIEMCPSGYDSDDYASLLLPPSEVVLLNEPSSTPFSLKRKADYDTDSEYDEASYYLALSEIENTPLDLCLPIY